VFDIDITGHDHAREVVLEWVRTRRPVREFVGTIEAADFEHNLISQEGLLAQAATSPDGRTTVARLQHREYDFDRGEYDPVRDWRTDITIGRDDQHAWIATRQWFKGIATDTRACFPPGFVRRLWEEGALSDVIVLNKTCWYIEFAEEIDELVSLILDERRALPVVVMANYCPLNGDKVADDSIGLAHVCRLSQRMRVYLNERMDDVPELVSGSARTFYPRIPGRPLFAPSARAETIHHWVFEGQTGAAGFGPWLHAEMARAIVARLLNDPAHRTFEEVRGSGLHAQREALDLRIEDVEGLREALRLASEERDLVEIDNEHLQDRITELSDQLQLYVDELGAAETGLREEREARYRLEQDKKALQSALAAKGGAKMVLPSVEELEKLIADQEEPRSVADAVEKAMRLFDVYGVNVVFSDEALESAFDSPFRRPKEVMTALVRLGFRWADIRSRVATMGTRLDKAAREELGYRVELHESDTAMKQYGGQRLVSYGTER
jgi:hypothetical protein